MDFERALFYWVFDNMNYMDPENSQPFEEKGKDRQKIFREVCGGEDGIYPFGTPYRKDNINNSEEYHFQKRADDIYDGLMQIISEVGDNLIEKSQSEGNIEGVIKKSEYSEAVAKVEKLALLCRKLASDEIPLYQTEDKDGKHKYAANEVVLGNGLGPKDESEVEEEVYNVDVMVRSDSVFNNGKARQDYDQPRLRVILRDKYGNDMAAARIEKEDAFHNYQITYDLELMVGGRNIIDEIDFNKNGFQGQRHTHHFTLDEKLDDDSKKGKMIFAGMLNEFNKKFQSASSFYSTPLHKAS